MALPRRSGRKAGGGGLLGCAVKWMLLIAGAALAATSFWQWQVLSTRLAGSIGEAHRVPASSAPYAAVPRDAVPQAKVPAAVVAADATQLAPAVDPVEPGRPDRDSSALSSRGKYKIFTYWEYPSGPNAFVKLNVESWRLYSPPGTEIVFVNNSNFKKLVPDAPDEWFRLPYAAAKSDVVRASLLYHHGGLYMDTDFVALNDLSPVFAKLDEGWDIVAYTDGKNPKEVTSGDCSQPGSRYSSNFMAGRKGNPFSETWWNNIKFKLTRMCYEGEMKMEKICCHEAFAPLPEKRPCHIPWAQIEHLKEPGNDHDGKGPPRADPTQKKQNRAGGSTVDRDSPEGKAILEAAHRGNKKATLVPNNTKVYCMRGREGMAPYCIGQIYWQPWDPVAGKTDKSKKGAQFDKDFACYMENDEDMVCDHTHEGSKRQVYPGFFKHIAYHLFFSTKRRMAKNENEILDYGWLISEMYRRMLLRRPSSVRSGDGR